MFLQFAVVDAMYNYDNGCIMDQRREELSSWCYRATSYSFSVQIKDTVFPSGESHDDSFLDH